MIEPQDPPFDGPSRSWECVNATPVSGSMVTVRAEYQHGGGIYLSAEHENGQPDDVWLSREQWVQLSDWYHGCWNFERAIVPPKVCRDGVSVYQTWCGVTRIKLGHEWWPRVGTLDEVTCPQCLEDKALWSEVDDG